MTEFRIKSVKKPETSAADQNNQNGVKLTNYMIKQKSVEKI